MIVGNGILASSFKRSEYNWDDVIIMASGVSNSNETDKEAYERERQLIKAYQHTTKTLVYFSTTSIYEEAKQQTMYIQYKKEIEEYISTVFSKSLIIRLPIVLSDNNNPRQLFGYIKDRIKRNEELIVHKNASRFFFDVEEIPRAAHIILENMQSRNESNVSINVGFPRKFTMLELVKVLEAAHPNLRTKVIDLGEQYETDFSHFLSLVNDRYSFKSNNPEALIRCYL